MPVSPGFESPVIFFNGLKEVHRHWGYGVLALYSARRYDFVEKVLYFLKNGCMIAFEGENVLGLFINDFGGNVLLTAHRIQGYYASFEFQYPKEFGNGRDFVGFVIDLDLS